MSGITIECPVHFRKARAGQKKLKAGESPQSVPEGSIPRVSRLMALAIRFDGLIRAGKVRDYAELARVGRVTRARLTQIMNLLNLAPDIQEEILSSENSCGAGRGHGARPAGGGGGMGGAAATP